MKRVAVIVAALLLLFAPSVFAQSAAVNPGTVDFIASPDHAVLGIDGQPILTRYELRLFQTGNATPFTVQNLGKPTPDAQNHIIVTNRSWFAPCPAAKAGDPLCYGVVAAIGPGGESLSGNSNPFGNEAAARAAGTVVIR